MEHPKRVKAYVGSYVKASREISNGVGKMPAGTIYKITGAGITFYFESLPCSCCGHQFKFSSKGTLNHKLRDMTWLGYTRPAEEG